MQLLYPAMAWWDPTEPASITLNGSTVAAWEDRVNGYVVSQPTAGLQPTFSATALNGHPGMGNNNLGRYLGGATPVGTFMAGTQPFSCLAYVRMPSSTPSFGVLVHAGVLPTSGAGIEGLAQHGPTTSLRFWHQEFVNGAIPLAVSTNYVLASSYGSLQARLYVDGVAEAGNPFSCTTAANGMNELTIGARFLSAAYSAPWNGLWGDIIVIPAALSPAEMIAGSAWIAARYA